MAEIHGAPFFGRQGTDHSEAAEILALLCRKVEQVYLYGVAGLLIERGR